MAEKSEKLTDDTLIAHAQERFKTSLNWRSEKIDDQWVRDSNQYDSVFDTNDKSKSDVLKGQGRLFIPKTYSHIQRMLVDILDVFFFDREEIVNISSWKTLPEETRQIVKTLLNYRLNNHPIQFYQEAYEVCLDALKTGVSVVKVYPFFEGKDQDGDFHPKWECVPYEDAFFDSTATWKDYYKHTIILRSKRSLDYLKRRGYKNLDDLGEPPVIDSGTDVVKQSRMYDQGSPFSNDSTMKKDQDSYYLYEIWTHLDLGDGLLKSAFYYAVGDESGPNTIISEVKENDLPYKWPGDDYVRPPILLAQALPEPHKMAGKSIPRITNGLQRETNAIRNQRREAVALAIRKPILASRSANLDLMSLVNRKIGSVVLGDDISPSSVRELDIRDPGNGSIQEMMRTDQDFFETTSISPPNIGVATSKEQTATESMRIDENANKKINQIIRNLVFTLFLPSFNMLLRLEQEYESDDFIALVTGRTLGWGFRMDGSPPKEFIQGDFDLIVELGTNKQAQLQKLMMIMDRGNMANQVTMQMVQAGIVNPQDVKFIDTMAVFKRAMPLLGEKNFQELEIAAQPPPVPVEAGGVASQPDIGSGNASFAEAGGMSLA